MPHNACGRHMMTWAEAEACLAQALCQRGQVAPRQEALSAVRRRRCQLLPQLRLGQGCLLCILGGSTVLGLGAVFVYATGQG